MLCAGLLVPSTDPGLLGTDQTGRHSPFVIAFNRAGYKVVRSPILSALWRTTVPDEANSQLPDLLNAAILVSAWSAAASDIYVGSRLLFFLARKGLAPSCFAHLLRFNKYEKHKNEYPIAEIANVDSDDEGPVVEGVHRTRPLTR